MVLNNETVLPTIYQEPTIAKVSIGTYLSNTLNETENPHIYDEFINYIVEPCAMSRMATCRAENIFSAAKDSKPSFSLAIEISI